MLLMMESAVPSYHTPKGRSSGSAVKEETSRGVKSRREGDSGESGISPAKELLASKRCECA